MIAALFDEISGKIIGFGYFGAALKPIITSPEDLMNNEVSFSFSLANRLVVLSKNSLIGLLANRFFV